MNSPFWINKLGLSRRPPARKPGRTTRAARPGLETLESRLAPASFLVASTGDDPSDPSSLRFALANLDSGTDVASNFIAFAPGLTGQTIILTTANGGELSINEGVTITGLGADLLAVSGGNTSRVFNITDGIDVEITGLTITDGLTTNTLGGGAIFNAGTLTLVGDAIINSTARGGDGAGAEGGGGGGAGLGGGIFNCGDLTLLSSTLSGNQAIGGTGGSGGVGGTGGSGGGPDGGTGSTLDSGVPGSTGGYASGGGGSYTTLGSGTAGGAGGFGGGGGGGGDPGSPSGGDGGFGGGSGGAGDGGSNGGGGGGGGGGFGGALFNADGATLTLINSTLSGNLAAGGTGGNGAGGSSQAGYGGSGYGGALFSNGDTVLITSATIAANSAIAGTGLEPGFASAGGVFIYDGGAVVNSTIIARNTADNPDVSGIFLDAGYNLIGNTEGNGFAAFTTFTGVDPLLSPLGYYGAATQTMSLRAGSLALNNGDPNGITFDQRGADRGLDGINAGIAPDIGAWEASSSYLVTDTFLDTALFGTLRGGIAWANDNVNPLLINPTSNIIRFDVACTCGLPQTIDLALVGDDTVGPSALIITADIEIDGSTDVAVTIARDLSVDSLRLFFVVPGASLTLNNLTLSDGIARGGDGGSGGGAPRAWAVPSTTRAT